jgi:hypothetical protein
MEQIKNIAESKSEPRPAQNFQTETSPMNLKPIAPADKTQMESFAKPQTEFVPKPQTELPTKPIEVAPVKKAEVPIIIPIQKPIQKIEQRKPELKPEPKKEEVKKFETPSSRTHPTAVPRKKNLGSIIGIIIFAIIILISALYFWGMSIAKNENSLKAPIQDLSENSAENITESI